jgi:Dolichyl-phosphate-mannose-protein mannosyltransferase
MDVSANATIGFLNRQTIRYMAALSPNKCVAAAILASIFFFWAGQPFIPLLGIQNDEALFAGAIYEPLEALYAWPLPHHQQIPLMLMSYLGCLKTLFYIPIFRLFGNGPYAVREPALIFGAASIWLFFLLLRRIAGERVGLIGCCLLAADSLYLLTTCYDWGPVALQHLLIVAGALLIVRFFQTGSDASLAFGFLIFGLALWDKALALWILSGFGIAGFLTFPRQILAAIRFRRLLICFAALALGAAPLISYNLHAKLATIRENTTIDTGSLITKFHLLTETARGGMLLGFLNAPDQTTPEPHQPRGPIEIASARLSALAGDPSSDWLLAAFLAAVLLAPLAGWPTLRIVVFFVIAMAVAWLQMALNSHTGGTVHHAILLWPWPEAAIAISFGGVSRKLGRIGAPAVAAATALVVLSSLLVTNEYYAKMVRNGGSPTWSGAVYPLAESLRGSDANYAFCTDWGILESVGLLNAWHPVMRNGILGEDENVALAHMVSDSSHIILAHVPEAEQFPGVNERIVERAAKLGYTKQSIRVIGDGFGRKVFEVYKFVRATQ